MDGNKENFISPTLKTVLCNLGLTKKKVQTRFTNKKRFWEKDDEFEHSGSEPLPPEERLEAAVKKFNAANELKIVAETNFFAELDNDFKLLQEYKAYKTPSLNNLEFIPISKDTVLASNNEKPIEIKFEILEDESKQYEIKFYDGSQINYVIFSEGAKMKINGEEFGMPAGACLEIKSVKGRVFSQLIQTPDMQKNVVNMPEIIGNIEQLLKIYNLE